MPVVILPIPIILLQCLCLLISIAIEAVIFQKKLNLSRKKSVQISIIINLFSDVIIWFFIFSIYGLAPQTTRPYIMSYVFFTNFYKIDRPFEFYGLSLGILVMVFILICLVEYKGLDLIKFIFEIHSSSHLQNNPSLFTRFNQALVQSNSKQATIIILANFFSNSIILLIILLNFLKDHG